MKKIYALVLVTVLTSNNVNSAPLVPPPAGMESFYYEIGAGTGIHDLGGVLNSQRLYLEKDFGLILGAGNFDPVFSIKQTLNNIQNEVKSKLVGIGSAITSSISALPGYIFCRANPLGCQLHENYTIRAEKKAEVATKYFEQVERDLAQQRGQLEGWFQAAKSNKLISAIKNAPLVSGQADLEGIVDEVREFKGEEGLKWIGGTFAGGAGQNPIRPIADTVKAGFNFLNGIPATNSSTVSGTDPILDIWNNPEEAAKWVADVVGEHRPDINNDRALSSGVFNTGSDDGDLGAGGEDVVVTQNFLKSDMGTAALGLGSKVSKESTTIVTKLTSLVNSDTPPTVDDLTQLMGKSSTTIIPEKLLFGLRNSKIQAQLIKKISDDIAISNVIHYAMQGRRMLLAGKQEPHIATYDIAMKEVDRKVSALEKEIELLMFERKINESLLSSSITKIVNYENQNYNKQNIAPTYDPNRSIGDGSFK